MTLLVYQIGSTHHDLVEMKIIIKFHSSMLDEVSRLMKTLADRFIRKVSQRGTKSLIRSFFVKTCY
jgi:hypothetical protein